MPPPFGGVAFFFLPRRESTATPTATPPTTPTITPHVTRESPKNVNGAGPLEEPADGAFPVTPDPATVTVPVCSNVGSLGLVTR